MVTLPIDHSSELRAGTRVRLTSAGIGVTPRSNLGTIVRPDRWLDYYIVRLDQPAIFEEFPGEREELTEICESASNLIPLDQ